MSIPPKATDARFALDLCERIIQAMKLRCPDVLQGIWSTTSELRPMWAAFQEGDFEFRYDQHHTIVIYDISGPRSFMVFCCPIDRPDDFQWDEHVTRNFVVPTVDRILVLEDMADV